MSTLTATNPTLLDLAQMMDPDGKISAVIEILNQKNELMQVLSYVEGNLPTGHQSSIRTGIPAPTWRKMYGGVQPTKATQVKVTDSCGMLEAYAEVDKALADINGNTAAFRLNQNKPHIEGIAQEIASTFFYGNEDTEPEAFTGLAPRFNLTTAENGENIILGGSADTDNTSIWLVVFGEEGVFGIVPKGSKAGMQVEDKGQVTIENADGNGGRMEAYRTHYRMDAGLVVADWRQVVRIPNIEISALVMTGATGADVIDLMTQALERVNDLGAGRPAFLCNRTIKSILRRQIVNKVASSTLTMDQVAGKPVMTMEGVPVLRCDAIVNTETLVA